VIERSAEASRYMGSASRDTGSASRDMGSASRDLGSAPRHNGAASRYVIVAAGKAARGMAEASVRALGDSVRGGVVIAPTDVTIPPLESIAGGHPTPNAASERAGRRAIELARSTTPDDLLLVLLSGGASALMAAPADGVRLEDKRATTARLLSAGADIHALNTVRKHLSAVKGGWLAAAADGRCRTFAISDVVGDDLSVIGSGPTVADASTFEQALDVLRRFGGDREYPPAVIAHLEAGARGRLAETPKPGDERLARATSTVIGGRRDAMDGAVREARTRGYHVLQIDDPVVGEARTTAVSHLRAVLARASGIGRPVCIVSSGETTVHVTGRGIGGRNQEFALATAGMLADTASLAAVASVGTDGVDGPTDAAGAIADSTTVQRATALRLGSAAQYLDDNNAYAFFARLGDLINTGPTGTNVGDLQVILLA
jgi:glycerate 2-kinase